MIFETKRLILRPWEENDVNILHELSKDPHVGPPCGWTPHVDMKESKEVLEDVLINDYTFALVLKETDKIIGNIALMPFCESRFPENENESEIGFWLGYPYWGNGYMLEACKCIIQYGFEILGLEKIWCAHDVKNHNSKRVQEKSGFVFHHEDSYYLRDLDKRIMLKVNCIENSKLL